MVERALLVTVSHPATNHQRFQFVLQFDLLPRHHHVLLALDMVLEVRMRPSFSIVLLREWQIRLVRIQRFRVCPGHYSGYQNEVSHLLATFERLRRYLLRIFEFLNDGWKRRSWKVWRRFSFFSWRISPSTYILGGCRERDRVFVVMEARLTVCLISRNSRDILV